MQRLSLLLWFDFIPGIYLASRPNVNLSNIAIAYLYNNNLTSVKPSCDRGESLNTAHIHSKPFHKVIFVSILVWVGRTVAFSPSCPYCHNASS